jgi:hypothetical protein
MLSVVTLAAAFHSIPAAAQNYHDLEYHTIPPCNVVNTGAAGGAFAANETRSYNVVGTASLGAQGGAASGCNIPGFSNGVAQVQAVQLIIMGINPSTGGYMVVWAADQPMVPIGELALTPGIQNLSVATVAVAQTPGVGDFKVNYAIASGHVVIQVLGYYTRTAQTVYVHSVPGDPAASGTALLNAFSNLAALTGSGAPSATRQYVVRLDPGIYDIGSTFLGLLSFVDLVGAGQEATIIRGTGYAADNASATIKASGLVSVEVHDLQIQVSASGSDTAIGLYMETSPITLRRVTVATTSGTSSYGIKSVLSNCTLEDLNINASSSGSSGSVTYGLVLYSSNAMVRRSAISVSGASYQNNGVLVEFASSPTLRGLEVRAAGAQASAVLADYRQGFGTSGQTLTVIDSTLQASGSGTNVGINVTGGGNTFTIVRTSATASAGTSYGLAELGGFGSNSYTIDHSQVIGVTGSVQLNSSFSAGASQLAGAVSAVSGTCAASYNGSYSALSATCH